MTLLITGLLLFLGTHSIRMFAPDWRQKMIDSMGMLPWRGLYSLIALAGFVLLVMGYGEARTNPQWLWVAPLWTKHLAALLTIPAFILVVAAYVPGTLIKARLGHPMVMAVKFWATAHLISNGTLADALLFGSFLAWAIANFAISRRRDRVQGITHAPVSANRDLIALAIGLALWTAFAFYFHNLLIGIQPLG